MDWKPCRAMKKKKVRRVVLGTGHAWFPQNYLNDPPEMRDSISVLDAHGLAKEIKWKKLDGKKIRLIAEVLE